MATLKTLRTRIRSVKNTQQITKTMKMVAAAKVRRARAAVEAARPYAAQLMNVLTELARNAGGTGGSLLLTGRPTVQTVRLIVCGSDRGLAGALNANLLKAAHRWVAEQQSRGRTVQLVAVGRKIRDGLRQSHPTLLAESFTDLGRTIEFAKAQEIAIHARTAFEQGTVDEVHLLCSECLSMLSQQPSFRKLVPFALGAADVSQPAPSLRPTVEYEPDEATVLERLLPLNLNMQVFSALLESSASEQAARMTAMDSATRNAGELRKKLTVEYNRNRQAAITKELIEIISGAQAV